MRKPRASFRDTFLDATTRLTSPDAARRYFSRLRFYNWRSAQKRRSASRAGQELQHCKGHVQRASYVSRGRQKSPADLSSRATTKEHAGDFSRRENYFLVKLRARKAAYNIRASPSERRTSGELRGGNTTERGEETGAVERVKRECETRDTSRLELQGSKDVGTCRDLQSRNYGYTIGNDTARTRARARSGPLSLCPPSLPPTKPRDIRSA